MIDQDKRNTLKTVAVTTAATAVSPALMTQAFASDGGAHATTGTYLAADIEIDPHPTDDRNTVWLRITNNSDESFDVRHIQPGVITSGDRAYDVNSALAHGPYRIHPDESYSFMVDPLESMDDVVPAPLNADRSNIVFMSTHFNGAPADGTVSAGRVLLG